MRWWPRTIRWQMLAGLLLLEVLSIGLFALLLVQQQMQDIHELAEKRLDYEVASLALQSREALLEQRPGWVGLSVTMMGEAPTVLIAKVTDPAGNMLFVSKGEADEVALSPIERAQIPLIRHDQPRVFTLEGNQWESVKAIYTGTDLRGFAWVEFDKTSARAQLQSILRDTAIFGVIWILASAVLVVLMAGSISRPLAILHRGTRVLMNSPESGGKFPLPVVVHNEIGDLIEAFNRMVASIEEQRAGLNDTLSLLDSMLANAPIGLAFLDRDCRFVRVNQFFADMTGFPLSRHLGRTLLELLPQPVARELESAVQHVFAREEPVRSLEINGRGGRSEQPWTWLVSAYPVRTTPQQVRWAGIIVLDASDRKRSEEALRRDGKAGRHGPPGRVDRPRDQQPAGSDHQSAVSAAQLLRTGGTGAELCGHGRARSPAHRGDHAADAAFLPAVNAARAGQNGGSARFRAQPLSRAAGRAEYPGGTRLRPGDGPVLLCRRDAAGVYQPHRQRH